jgi:hypothetical protein
MSPSMRETAKTIALQRRLKRSVEKLEQMDPECDLLGEYRVMNAPILRHIRWFRVSAELRLSRARTKAERAACRCATGRKFSRCEAAWRARQRSREGIHDKPILSPTPARLAKAVTHKFRIDMMYGVFAK